MDSLFQKVIAVIISLWSTGVEYLLHRWSCWGHLLYCWHPFQSAYQVEADIHEKRWGFSTELGCPIYGKGRNPLSWPWSWNHNSDGESEFDVELHKTFHRLSPTLRLYSVSPLVLSWVSVVPMRVRVAEECNQISVHRSSSRFEQRTLPWSLRRASRADIEDFQLACGSGMRTAEYDSKYRVHLRWIGYVTYCCTIWYWIGLYHIVAYRWCFVGLNCIVLVFIGLNCIVLAFIVLDCIALGRVWPNLTTLYFHSLTWQSCVTSCRTAIRGPFNLTSWLRSLSFVVSESSSRKSSAINHWLSPCGSCHTIRMTRIGKRVTSSSPSVALILHLSVDCPAVTQSAIFYYTCHFWRALRRVHAFIPWLKSLFQSSKFSLTFLSAIWQVHWANINTGRGWLIHCLRVRNKNIQFKWLIPQFNRGKTICPAAISKLLVSTGSSFLTKHLDRKIPGIVCCTELCKSIRTSVIVGDLRKEKFGVVCPTEYYV